MEQIEDLHVIFHHIVSVSLRARIQDHARLQSFDPARNGHAVDVPPRVLPIKP
jgi:hypothetical protein